MKNIVFNNQLNKASVLGGGYPKLSRSEEKELLAGFFEQLLLFDHIVISTGRENYTLFFLIKNLGIDTVERLFKAGYIKLSIKSTVIFAGSGRMNADGTLDSSTVIGQPPIVGASLVDDDLDVEKNIHQGILAFRFQKKRQRELNKIIAPNYLSTDSMDLGVSVTELVVNSYKSNLLENLGLPFDKEPEQFSVEERTQLLHVASSVLEMGIISKNSFKSYNNYENFEIAKSAYVIHEAGLFQGRLGFDKVVILKQEGIEEFSNIAGLQYIPFSQDNIEQSFYELQRKFKKLGLIK